MKEIILKLFLQGVVHLILEELEAVKLSVSDLSELDYKINSNSFGLIIFSLKIWLIHVRP